MISAGQIEQIISLYQKHGWILRRVLLSDEFRVNLNEFLQPLFGGAEIVSSPFLNALWFSRPSGKTGETWEIRHLSATPFAFVQVFPNELSEDEREKARNEMQTRLVDQTSKS